MNRLVGTLAPTIGLLAWVLATPASVSAQESHDSMIMNNPPMDHTAMDSTVMGGMEMDSTAMGGMDMDHAGGMDMDHAGGMVMGGMSMDDMDDNASRMVHAVHMAGQQSELSELVMKYMLLVALDIDREANLIRLSETRDMFEQVQRGLHNGDSGLGLHAISNDDVLASIELVDKEWADMAPIIQHCLDAGHVTPEWLRSLLSAKPRLETELSSMADKVKYFTIGGSYHSILTTTTNAAQGQLALLGQMTNQYLLIAYDKDEEAHRARLQQSYTQFDRVLMGLIEGDANMQILAAPTPELRDRYAEISRMWRGYQALLAHATMTGRTDSQSIRLVTAQVSELAGALEDAVVEYHRLF